MGNDLFRSDRIEDVAHVTAGEELALPSRSIVRNKLERTETASSRGRTSDDREMERAHWLCWYRDFELATSDAAVRDHGRMVDVTASRRQDVERHAPPPIHT